MNVNYNCLSRGRDAMLKNRIGDSVGSPPNSSSKTAKNSWLVATLLFILMFFKTQVKTQFTVVTKAISSLVSTILVLLGLKGENIGLGAVKKVSLINFETRNRFGIYSFKAALVFLLFVSMGTKAQVTTNSSSGLAATYPTLAAAITALNGATITAPVTISLTASNPQTAPAGGYSITATGTATNTITITGNSNTITAPAQTSGSLNDAIFKIIGGDFITIQGFTMQENAANTTTTAASNNMTEFGVALFYAAVTNGAQNCTIQNNTITLNRTYQNTFGIYANATSSATAVTTSATGTTNGGNSGLKVYGNTISNVNNGILVLGPTAAANYNTGIDIGGTSSATANTISNFGTTGTFSSFANVSGTVYGIFIRNSIGFNVSYNSITSSNGGVTAGTLRGIFNMSASAAPTGTFTNNINNNTIALTYGVASGTLQGITVEAANATTTSVGNINNNNFTALTASLATSATITAISSVAPHLTLSISGNTFTNLSTNTTGSFTFFGHSYTMPATGTQTLNNNSIVTAFNKTGAGGTVIISTSASSSPNGTTHTFTNNNFSNITVTGATGITGVTNTDGSGTSATRTVTGNTFNNWTGGTSNITGMSYGYIGGTTSTVSNNTLTNITGQANITGISVGSSASLATTLNVANNTINNLSSTGTGGQVLGISSSNVSTTININNNAINTLSTTGATSAVGGILVTNATTTNIFSNTIFGLTSSSAGSPLVLGISVQGGATVNTYLNKIYGLSASGAISTASPAVVGINATGGTNVNTYNNILGGLTAPAASLTDAIRGINITSSAVTSNQRVYYNTINLNGTSSGANFGSTGLFHTYSATATTSALDMRNNIIVNSSTAAGTGLAVAFRRSAATDLANYATTSNNNLFFGTSGVYNDGAATYAFGPFKTLVSTRETASRNQNPSFASTTGANATFLHFVADAVNLAGANGQVIAGYTTDFDGNTRDASTPDIGADEWVNGVIALPTVSSFTPATLCLAGGQTVTITGTGLSTATSVLFNSASGVDLPGVITGATDTTLTVTTPASVVDGIIRVVNPAGSADSAATFATVGAPTIGVSSAATICSGTSTSLTATGGVSYAWSPATGLSAATGDTVTASPTSTRTYTVTGTSSFGCTATNTVAVTVNPTPTAVTLSKVPTIACLGGASALTATGGQIGLPGTATIGTGTTATSAAATEPTAFNNRYKHYWMQMVFTPAELNAAGIVAGNITAVRFTTTTLGDAATVTDLKVRMGTSSSATLSAFQPNGLTLVKTSATYTHAVGVNTLTFDTPYAWDGVSNLLFDLRSTGADATNNARTLYTATTGNTVVSAITSTTSSSDGFAALSPFATTSTFRLNTTFDATVLSNGPISWSPTTDLFTDSAATTAYTGTDARTVYSKSTTAQTYTASGTLGSCTATSAGITVTPNPLPTITVASVSICNGGSTALAADGASTYVWSPATGLSATTGNVIATANPTVTTEYTITGTDSNGCINTTTATVTVNTPVAITSQPTNAIVNPGSDATFTVAASGTGLGYQWEESTNSGASWSAVSGATSASLTVSGVTLGMNGYSYRCIVSGAAPCASVTSAERTITVSSISILAQPVNQTVCSNTSATFTISATGATTYQWQINTGSGWSDVSGETGVSLVLSGITSANSGASYRILLNGGSALGGIDSDSALLTVYDVVAIATQPANQSVCNGAASVTFTAAATGSGLAYQWQVNSGSGWSNLANNATYSGATTASLLVTSPAASLNNNQYQVIVSGTAPCSPVTSSAATLTITNVTVAATSASICIGGSTTLNATFTGAPDYTTASWTSTTGSGAETAVSGISATVTPTAAGNYTYTFASDGTCPFTRTVAVTVNALPVISAVTATPAAVCSGATIALNGASVVSLNGSSALGAGATDNSTTINSFFPGGWGGAKSQYLIRASELTALGYVAGNITSLGFEPTSAGQTYQGFFVSIASTSSTVLTTTFLANGTQVYAGTLTDNGFLPVANVVNTLAFGTGSGSASSFAWDGVSNIVVTFSWSRVPSAATATASTMKSDTVGFVCGAYRQRDSLTPAAMLAETSALSTGSVRPRLRLGGVLATNLASTYTWSWNTTPPVSTAIGTTSVTNTSGTAATSTFTATATNAAGCTSSLTTSAVTVNSTIPAPTGTDSAQCGTITPTCSVAGTGRAGNTFRWYTVASAGTAIAGQTGSTLVAPFTAAATTTFYVAEVSPDGLCESERTAVTVTVTTPFAFTLSSAATTNCAGSASLTPVTIATNGGYDTYSWSNAATVSGNETTGWTFSPTTTTTYTLTVSGGGCSTTASVVVTPTALPVVNITTPSAAICVGGSSTLTALTNVVAAGTATIGSGTDTTSLSTTGTPFRMGSTVGNQFRNQFLILPSELTSFGLKAGNITALTLDVSGAGGGTLSNLSVSMGNSALSAMTTTYVTGLSQVFTAAAWPATGTLTTGLQTFTFTTPFNWDGTSSIVIEVCAQLATGGTAGTLRGVATSYVSHIGNRPSTTGCSTATSLTTFSVRPNIVLNGQVAAQGAGTLAYTWNDPATTTGNVLTVSPTSTTAYTVSAFNSVTGCTNTASSTITVFSPPTAPSVTSATQCGAVVPTIAVADTNGYTTPTFKWYADDTTTTALQTSTSTTYTTSVSATTTFYVAVVSPGGCESPRAAVTTTVLTPATLTVSPAVGLCSGNNTVLTASGADSYTWSPATGLSATTGSSVTASPTTSTTYTVIGVDANGCTTAAATVAVSVTQPLAAVTAGVVSPTVCVGGTVSLTSTNNSPAPINYAEGFETFPPTGWTFINAGSGNSFGFSTAYPRTGVNSLAYGYNTSFAANAWAIAPAQNLSAGITYTISYWYRTTSIGGLYPENLRLTVGTSNTVASQTTVLLNQPNLVDETFLQATATFTPSVSGVYYFGLNCYSAADQNLLAIDDFSVTGSANTTFAWTSTPAGFTSTVQNPTNVTVSQETVYTVTETFGSCSSSSSVTVTPTALPTFTLTPVTICNGNSTTIVIPESGYGYSWSPATGLDTTAGATVVASPSVTTTYTVVATDVISGCQKTETVVVTVNNPPAVSSISPITNNVAIGQATNFTVAATGTGLTYQWQVDDSTGMVNIVNDANYSGATSATLSIASPTAEMNGYLYQCVVSGTEVCTSATSDAATLSVDTTGITTQPSNTSICSGSSTSFITVATSVDPEQVITYAWEVKVGTAEFVAVADGFDATTGLTFSGAETGTLAMSGTTVANSGLIFHSIVNGYIFSSDATLTVSNPVTIATQPTNQSTCAANGTATFSVAASNVGSYAWEVSSDSGASWSAVSGATASSLVITNPAASMNGNLYRVLVNGISPCTALTSDVATLTVINPTVTANPVAASVINGNATTFSVTASEATTYQWQYSLTLNGVYANVVADSPLGVSYSGATSASLTVNTTAGTTPTGAAGYYRCIASNGSCSSTSTGALLTVVFYCTPAPSSVDASGITNVTLGSISNASGAETGNYGDYSAQSTSVAQLASVNFAITYATGYTYGTRIWIDYNDNADFTDAGELVYSGISASTNPTTLSGTITIPLTAPVGVHRLRIGGTDDDTVNNPCYTGTYGAYEDYSIEITAAPQCSGTPVAGTASAVSASLCAGNSASLTLNGTTSSLGISLQWYSSANNVDFAPIVGQTAATLATGALSANAYYYCAVTCANSSETVNSNTVSITVYNPLITGSTPAGRCGTGTVALAATASDGDVVNWYAAATGGSVLSTGTSFTTPSIAATTTYYAEATTAPATVSGLGNTSIPTAGFASAERGIVFTANNNGTIVSAQYYSESLNVTNTVTVRLVNNTTGVQVGSSLVLPIVQGATAGFYTMDLNLPVQAGTSYRLLAGFTSSVSRISSGVNYSSAAFNNLAPLGVITSGWDFSVSTTSYNYFHNITVISSRCPSARTAVTATVTPLPTATISYTTPLCSTAGTASVTLNGTNAYTGGTYTSTAGLTLNGSTGAIDVATSTPGTYTVTYTTNAVENCVAQTATTSVTINQALTSDFAYDTATYCSNQGVITPTISGTAGTFTVSPSGLTLNGTTGAITLATSTAGTYTVTNTVVVAGCANSVTSVTVTVNAAVAISSQPASVSKLPAENASFAVTASGTGLTYQWQVNSGSGWSNLSDDSTYAGTTTATLSLTAVTAGMDQYQYQVIVSGAAACAPVTSSAATLTVNDAAITAQPANFTACNEGANNASFAIATSGTATSFQWQVNTGSGFVSLSNAGVYSGVDTATLSLTGVDLTYNSYTYRCVVNGVVNSNAATLSVKTAVAITAQPSNTTGCSAGSASFTVAASGSDLSYQWRVSTDGTTWNNVSGATSATLTLNGLTAGMNGNQYQAIVSGASPCAAVTSSAVTLTVNTAVAVTTQPVASTICSNGSTSFTVAASGTTPTYTWEENTGSGWALVSNGGVYSNATTATLAITGATLTMNGYQYRAIVSGASPCGSVTSSAVALTISQPAAPIMASASIDVCSDVPQLLSVTNPTLGTSSTIITSGTGTSSTSGAVTGAGLGPNPMQSYYGGTRQQSLFTAAELTALGITNGAVLSSVAINLSAVETRDLQNYTVKMKNTTTTTFATSTFETGATTVRNSANYQPVVGWNTLALDSNFTYTGGSLIVEFTFSNNDNGGSGTSVATFNTTTNTATLFFRGDTQSAATVASATTATYAQTRRNNMQFGVLSASTTWSPTTGLFTDAAGTIAYTGGGTANVYAKVNSSATYTATNVNGLGCTNASTVSVNVATPSTLGSITQPSITCSGAQTTFNLTGLLPNSTSTISYNVNGGATLTVAAIVADASGNASFTRAFSAGNNGQTFTLTAIQRTDLTPSCSTAISANNTVVISVQPTVTYFADTDGDGFGNIAAPNVTCLGQPAGYVTNSTDCDDTDSTKNATFTFYADVDGDTYGAGSAVTLCAVNASTPPAGYSVNNTDCNDADATKNATYSFYADVDGDTYGAGSAVTLCAVNASTPPSGYSVNSTDCDDTNINIYQFATFFVDSDGDGYTNGTASVCSGVGAPAGYSATTSGTDCNDADSTKYQTSNLFTDSDGDGYTVGAATAVCYGANIPSGYAVSSLGTDCDDTSSSITTGTTFYADADNDTFGDLATTSVACTQPSGYVTNSTDCDPADGTKWQLATFFVDADADGYDNGSASVCSGAGAPIGYSATTSGTDCDDNNNLVYQSNDLYTDADADGYTVGVATAVCYGATIPSGKSLTSSGTDCNDNAYSLTNNCAGGSVVNLTMFVEGYYIGSGAMNSVKLNQDGVSSATEVEDVTVELHDATTYALVDTATGTLNTDGSLSVTFNTAAAGSYYIAVNGSNLIQTWSAEPQTVGTTPLSYDFSIDATQAYGSNMREMEPGVFAFYSGDVNQDQVVDNADLDPMYPDIDNSAFGVLATDINGDGVIDNSDLDNLYINLDNSVFANYPQ